MPIVNLRYLKVNFSRARCKVSLTLLSRKSIVRVKCALHFGGKQNYEQKLKRQSLAA